MSFSISLLGRLDLLTDDYPDFIKYVVMFGFWLGIGIWGTVELILFTSLLLTLVLECDSSLIYSIWFFTF